MRSQLFFSSGGASAASSALDIVGPLTSSSTVFYQPAGASVFQAPVYPSLQPDMTPITPSAFSPFMLRLKSGETWPPAGVSGSLYSFKADAIAVLVGWFRVDLQYACLPGTMPPVVTLDRLNRTARQQSAGQQLVVDVVVNCPARGGSWWRRQTGAARVYVTASETGVQQIGITLQFYQTGVVVLGAQIFPELSMDGLLPEEAEADHCLRVPLGADNACSTLDQCQSQPACVPVGGDGCSRLVDNASCMASAQCLWISELNLCTRNTTNTSSSAACHVPPACLDIVLNHTLSLRWLSTPLYTAAQSGCNAVAVYAHRDLVSSAITALMGFPIAGDYRRWAVFHVSTFNELHYLAAGGWTAATSSHANTILSAALGQTDPPVGRFAASVSVVKPGSASYSVSMTIDISCTCQPWSGNTPVSAAVSVAMALPNVLLVTLAAGAPAITATTEAVIWTEPLSAASGSAPSAANTVTLTSSLQRLPLATARIDVGDGNGTLAIKLSRPLNVTTAAAATGGDGSGAKAWYLLGLFSNPADCSSAAPIGGSKGSLARFTVENWGPPLAVSVRDVASQPVMLAASAFNAAATPESAGAVIAWSAPQGREQAFAPLAFVVNISIPSSGSAGGGGGGSAFYSFVTEAAAPPQPRSAWRQSSLSQAQIPSSLLAVADDYPLWANESLAMAQLSRLAVPCTISAAADGLSSAGASLTGTPQLAQLPFDNFYRLPLNASIGAQLADRGGTVGVRIHHPLWNAPSAADWLPGAVVPVPPVQAPPPPLQGLRINATSLFALVDLNFAPLSQLKLRDGVAYLGVDARLFKVDFVAGDISRTLAGFSTMYGLNTNVAPTIMAFTGLEPETAYEVEFSTFVVDRRGYCTPIAPAALPAPFVHTDCPLAPLQGRKVTAGWANRTSFSTFGQTPAEYATNVSLAAVPGNASELVVSFTAPRSVGVTALIVQSTLQTLNGVQATNKQAYRQVVPVVEKVVPQRRRRAAATEATSDADYRLVVGAVQDLVSYQATLRDLFPGATYNMTYALQNDWGMGPFVSKVVTVSTLEGVPEAPVWVGLDVDANSAAVTARWQLRGRSNGKVLGFVVFYRPQATQPGPFLRAERVVDLQATTNTALDEQRLVINNLQGGVIYEFAVAGRTAAGEGARSPLRQVLVQNSASSSSHGSQISGGSLAGIAVAIVLIILAVIALFLFRGRKQSRYNKQLELQLQTMKLGVEELTAKVKDMFSREFAETIGGAVEQTESDFARLEIDRTRLKMGRELGKGAFGVVCLATLTNPHGVDRPVAVKTLLEGVVQEELTKFLMEARLMSLLCHENLLELVAVCTKETPFYIVTELMSKVKKFDLWCLLCLVLPHVSPPFVLPASVGVWVSLFSLLTSPLTSLSPYLSPLIPLSTFLS